MVTFQWGEANQMSGHLSTHTQMRAYTQMRVCTHMLACTCTDTLTEG